VLPEYVPQRKDRNALLLSGHSIADHAIQAPQTFKQRFNLVSPLSWGCKIAFVVESGSIREVDQHTYAASIQGENTKDAVYGDAERRFQELEKETKKLHDESKK
jgi:hypothetical protein